MLAGTFEFTVTVCLLPTPREQELLIITIDDNVISAMIFLWISFIMFTSACEWMEYGIFRAEIFTVRIIDLSKRDSP